MSSLTLTLIQTSLNPSRLLVLPDHSRLCHMTSRSCALLPLQTNNNTIYLCPANPNPSQSLSTLLFYNTDVVEAIIKNNHIFNNITVASRPRVIKVSPKSNMAIIWLDIWNIQSRSKAKSLINCCFNVRSFVAMIHGANMNPGVLQYKNCWKWEHATFACRIQKSKCIKYNGLHKSEHYHHFAWCCKVNNKTNSPRLETKQGELCPHIFKCSNYKGKHQADSNICLFWKHYFNREWHSKKYQTLCRSRRQLIHSVVNSNQA